MKTDRDLIRPAAQEHAPRRFGLVAALAGTLGVAGPLLGVSPVSEAAANSGGAAILAEIQAQRLPIALGAVATLGAAMCVVALAAGLKLRFAAREPMGGALAATASGGLALSAGALLVGAAATYQLWWQAGGAYDAPDLVAAAFLVADTVPFAAWAGVGLSAAATAIGALRRAFFPRWYGWFSAAVAIVIAAMSVAMVPFMAFMPAGLWLVISGFGLGRGRAAAGRPSASRTR